MIIKPPKLNSLGESGFFRYSAFTVERINQFIMVSY